MEIIIAVLLCVVGFLTYLFNKQREEILFLKDEIYRLHNKKTDVVESLSTQTQTPFVSDENTFVRVIFKKNDTKYYDYLLGDNRDVKIGDFVEVYFNNKLSGKTESHVAKVIYISKPGEISEYARSKIKRKADRPTW